MQRSHAPARIWNQGKAAASSVNVGLGKSNHAQNLESRQSLWLPAAVGIVRRSHAPPEFGIKAKLAPDSSRARISLNRSYPCRNLESRQSLAKPDSLYSYLVVMPLPEFGIKAKRRDRQSRCRCRDDHAPPEFGIKAKPYKTYIAP